MTTMADMTEESRRNARGWATKRRRALAAKKMCINGESHGPATQGCRCDWCAAVHKHGVVAVLAMENPPPRPHPNHHVRILSRDPVPEIAGEDVSATG